jgi:hypothetical protein
LRDDLPLADLLLTDLLLAGLSLDDLMVADLPPDALPPGDLPLGGPAARESVVPVEELAAREELSAVSDPVS